MLTIKQPAQYGYKSVHDLPTPPSTSRPSPPLTYEDHISRSSSSNAIPRSSTSPSSQPMSAPLRGLPPPAAIGLSHQAPPPPPPPGHQQHHPQQQQHQQPQPHQQQQPPPPQQQAHQGPPPTHSQAPAPHPPSSSQSQYFSQLPPPPPWQQGSDEPWRNWLHAKGEEERRRQEEEKRRQEEERTRQETLKLEQRRVEQDMLRQSLSGGVPPSLVPVLFVAMGGSGGPSMNQAAILDWVQQHFLQQQQPGQHSQILAPQQGTVSPNHRRDSQPQGYGQYPPSVVPSTPGSAPTQSFGGYPSSPRARGQSLSIARPMGAGPSSNLPSLNTGLPPGQSGPPTTMAAHPTHPQSGPAQQQQQQQQEAQGSPIYFHHWQPPTTQGSSSNQPTTPSVGESPKKRKATGPQPGPPMTQQRLRSPPFVHPGPSAIANPPPGRRRGGHSRQRSDLSSYRGGSSRGGASHRVASPIGLGGSGSGGFSREGTSEPSRHHEQQQQHQLSSHAPGRASAHSVSSLLSSDHLSPQSAPYLPPPPPSHHHQQHAPSMQSPHQLADEQPRGGGMKHDRDNE
ncbi:hypothetical protein MKZ38_004377 [Zalerion maritima]|uniref:Uncharacterized protein n=1 Tax=Zalerion maritima TaxID=339359 RepID=A0AAD5WR15_9PEZI|nr:hypothetical protein MKZ38_004377 [Zalerion maritima]